MSELKREQIIKALECCAYGFCRDCALYSDDGCGNKVIIGAIETITSQEQKIKELTDENERLKKTNEYYSELEQGCYVTGVKNVTADTVREIETRFAMRYGTYTDKDMTPITEVFSLLDQIAKEMLEG